MPKSIKIRDKDYAKLEKYADKHDLSMVEVLNLALGKLEVKKLPSEKKDIMICCECEAEIPNTCNFCPNCGVEFETVVEAESLSEALKIAEREESDSDSEEEEEEEEEEESES